MILQASKSIFLVRRVSTIFLQDFRACEVNTAFHCESHIGKYYNISTDEKKQLFTYGGLPKSFERQSKTFGETCIMIRQPAIKIIEYIENFNFSNQRAIRFVLFGDNGTGKTLTMAHILHYGLQNNFIIVHVPWAANWYKKPKEVADSQVYENYTDLPFDAASWLMHFKTQNSVILNKYDLKLTEHIFWNKRETTVAGSSILELLEHGITRVKYASDTINVLISELKKHSNSGKCKLLIAIDGFNSFYSRTTRIYGPHKICVTPDKVTMTKPFLDLTNHKWHNAVYILTSDKIASTKQQRDSYLPRYLLGEGFDHLNPFIPIKVDNYNKKELRSCISYYINKKWIQNNNAGYEKELEYLSVHNPYKLMNICISL